MVAQSVRNGKYFWSTVKINDDKPVELVKTPKFTTESTWTTAMPTYVGVFDF
jgi:hypothetical protein